MSRLRDLVQAQKAGRALQLKPKGFQGPSKAWVVVEDGRVTNLQTGESVAVAGAHADVDSMGQLEKRITATRLILTGPLAFGLRKKKTAGSYSSPSRGRTAVCWLRSSPSSSRKHVVSRSPSTRSPRTPPAQHRSPRRPLNGR